MTTSSSAATKPFEAPTAHRVEETATAFAKNVPGFAALLAVATAEERLVAARALPAESRGQVVAAVVSYGFQLEKAGRLSEAFDWAELRRAIVLMAKDEGPVGFMGLGLDRHEGDALVTMSSLQQSLGQRSVALGMGLEAESAYARDAAARRDAGQDPDAVLEFDRVFGSADFRSTNLRRLTGLALELGDEALARQLDEDAARHLKVGYSDEGRYDTLMARARHARGEANPDEALGHLAEAVALAKSMPGSRITAWRVVGALEEMAAVLDDEGLTRGALRLYEEALQINRDGRHRGRMLDNLICIGGLRTKAGDPVAARAAWVEALATASLEIDGATPDDVALAWSLDDKPYRLLQLDRGVRILQALAALDRTTDPDLAIAWLDLAIAAVEQLRTAVLTPARRIAYQRTVESVFEAMIELRVERFEATAEQEHLQALFRCMDGAKSRVLLEILAARPLPPPRGVGSDVLAAEAAALEAVDRCQAQIESGSNASELADALEEARAACRAAWARILVEDPQDGPQYVMRRTATPVSWTELLPLLRERAPRIAVVSQYFTATQLVTVVGYSDDDRMACHRSTADRAAYRRWAAVDPADPPAIDLRLPYWQLDFAPIAIDPIRPLLDGYPLVCFIPHDMLHGMPLHAFTAADGTCLAATAAVAYAPSASMLRHCLAGTALAAGADLVMGNPQRPDQPSLAHTEPEALFVAGQLACEALIGPEATREAFIRLAPGARHVHAACHALFDAGDPMASALLLSDGDLTANDVLALHLGASTVVLSACQTGVSGAAHLDELMGLARALLHSGARAVVLSLWNTFDRSAAALMRRFYLEYIDAGLGRAAALAAAQRELRDGGASIAEWAPFILIGDFS